MAAGFTMRRSHDFQQELRQAFASVGGSSEPRYLHAQFRGWRTCSGLGLYTGYLRKAAPDRQPFIERLSQRGSVSYPDDSASKSFHMAYKKRK
jgi:hypothetical protein